MAEGLKPVYLLMGSDRPKVARALQRLRARVGEEAAESLSAETASGDDAVAACNALGLFADEARLVVVDGVERWKAPDTKAIAAYLASPAPATVLALVGDEVKRDSPLAKACVKGGELLVYDVVRKKLPDWVAEQFRLQGVEADAAACRALVEIVGDDLYELASEAAKLAAWAGGEPIGEREVELLAVPHGDTPVFAVSDAWGRRDVAGLLAATEALLERGDDPSRLAAVLASHVGRVRACQALDAEGVRPREAAARLKMHPFAAEKAFGQAGNYSAEELRAATVRLAQLDHALKGGSRLAGELELERALIDITRIPEATPAD